METTTAILLTALQRMLAIAVGAFLCYLGYRLFLKVPTKEDSNGKIILPSGLAIHLTRVGPGVFFSLFGTLIMIFFFLNPMEYTELITHHQGGDTTKVQQASAGSALGDTNSAAVDQTKLPQVSSIGANSISSSSISKRIAGASTDNDQLHDEAERNTNRAAVKQNITSLNQVAALISSNLSLDASERRTHLTKIDNIKYSLMKGVWSKDWGSRDDFFARVIQGNKNLALNQSAYAFFNTGL